MFKFLDAVFAMIVSSQRLFKHRDIFYLSHSAL